MAIFEQTGLWSRAFGNVAEASNRQPLDRLRASYWQLWENAKVLAAQIQKSAPGLTLHDEAHFDALWARADQIAGPALNLTPLEIFVFGAAILLHDNANSVAAFSGGLDEIVQTPEWADAVHEWCERQPDTVPKDNLPQDGRDAVLFETLRSIHAQRAESLAFLEVRVDEDTIRLLPDDNLRRHLGEVIGKIAASHHWDSSSLPERLPDRVGSLPGMPADWVIRPVLLACLLRCADAVQLDQSRAPDFLFGLLKLRGLSAEHWRAQNRLATPIVDPDDAGALRLTSTVSFPEAAADAWWIAYEAVHIANRELQSADAQLRDLRLPAFSISRIRGAESPLRLTEQIRVQGWQPVAAEVKVSDVARIIGTFGGAELYGHDYTVPLRELIQNAADAVRLRRQLEPTGSGYAGRILIRLLEADQAFASLSVEDDGIGMSTAVLTGPLIDFGGSYLTSGIVKRERPGLKAEAWKRIGKYGIGFFSSFMLADEVRVITKPFDAGRDMLHTLLFRRGIFDRPLLIDGGPTDFASLASTRVVLKVSSSNLESMLSRSVGLGSDRISYSLKQLVGVLCPMLDVDVHVDDGSGLELLHSANWFAEDRRKWLTRILAPETAGHDFVKEQIESAAERLRPIDPSDPSAGVAAIIAVGAAGVRTVGTLQATSFFSRYSDDYMGTIDYEPGGPKREAIVPRAKELIPVWATEQATLLAACDLPIAKRQAAAERVADFGGDASLLFGLMLNGEWMDLGAIVARLKTGEPLYVPMKSGDMRGGGPQMARVREHHSGFLDNYAPGELRYLVSTLEASDSTKDKIYRYETKDSGDDVGFFGIIGKRLASEGCWLIAEGVGQIEFAEYVGEASPRQRLFPGKKIVTAALRLTSGPVGSKTPNPAQI